MSPFCGVTDTVCFGLRLTSPMGFKTMVDAPLPALDVTCSKWIHAVNSGQALAYPFLFGEYDISILCQLRCLPALPNFTN